jgi:hypothetical protein
MALLPPPDEQAWLLDELGRLIDQRGWETWREAVLRVPTDEHFPDPWSPDARGLERLTRRLLSYAGLGALRIRMHLFEGEQSIDQVSATGEAQYRHHGAAAWFAGIDGREVRFGCATREIEEAGEGLVGVLAHEVAHAWRHAHGLVEADRDLEECLTDLSTVYLGFGVFTVNNTFRFRTFSEERGAQLFSGWRKSAAGYLSPQSMSFLFAAWILGRRLGCWQSRQVLGWLEPRQRGFVRAALRELRPAEALERRLSADSDSPQIDLRQFDDRADPEP